MSRDTAAQGSERHGNLFITWAIEDDQDCPNPLTDCDAMGEILSLNRRHINYDVDRIEAEIENPETDAVRLAYYEHGLCQWMVAADGHHGCPDWRWDGTSFAGIWRPDQCLWDEARDVEAKARAHKLDDYRAMVRATYAPGDAIRMAMLRAAKGVAEVHAKEARQEKMREWASQACEAYTQWCNGECYGYVVKAYAVNEEGSEDPEDYAGEEVLSEDSCWGFIGWEDIQEEVPRVVTWMAEHVTVPEPRFIDPAMA